MTTPQEQYEWWLTKSNQILQKCHPDFTQFARVQHDEQHLYIDFPPVNMGEFTYTKELNDIFDDLHVEIQINEETQQPIWIIPKFAPPNLKKMKPYSGLNLQPSTPNSPAVLTAQPNPSYNAPSGVNNNQQTTSQSEVKKTMSVKLSTYTESNSKWVSEKNSKIGDIFVILTKPYLKESDFKGVKTQQMVIDVKKENQEETMNMKINKANARKLINIFGAGPNDDGEPWPGRKVRIDDFKPEQNGKSLVLSPL